MHFSTGLSKQRANKSPTKFCWILLQKLPKHWLWSRTPVHTGICCWGVLLPAGHYSGYKALESQINSKLQNSTGFFYSIAVSQKTPIYIHWAVICSCFKALSCPSNLLWSQEELADLNRGLSHYSSAQLAGCSQTCHFILELTLAKALQLVHICQHSYMCSYTLTQFHQNALS